jgi:hypothetical protein
MEKLTIVGKKMVRLSFGRQFRQLSLGLILLIVFFVPGTHALAASSSASLAVTVAVVRSCNIATALPVISDAKTSITPDSIVTTLCAHGFNPAITVHSGRYASDVARTRFSAGNTTRSVSTESSADRPPVETHGNRLGSLPVRSGEPRAIRLPEPMRDVEKGSYEDSVKVTINF